MQEEAKDFLRKGLEPRMKLGVSIDIHYVNVNKTLQNAPLFHCEFVIQHPYTISTSNHLNLYDVTY
jgi:hypothetical protein